MKIKTSDNIDLLGWYHEKDLKKYKTILYFHGNAGSLENRIHKLNHFNEMDVNFLIIAWRGFSGNQGKPSEKGLYEDGRSGINWLINKGVKEENIVIYGESLGTGVATHLSQSTCHWILDCTNGGTPRCTSCSSKKVRLCRGCPLKRCTVG